MTEGGRTLDATESALQLADYRRRVAHMYALAREGDGSPEGRWERFRSMRDALFARHPCSPLEPGDRAALQRIPYYPFDPDARVLATADDDAGEPFEVVLAEDGVLRLRRVARLSFELYGRPATLALYSMLGYGGGLFLPFSDATVGGGTHGGGRYLLDTVKHADLGTDGGRLVLDFNYAYHPSCAYSARWDCPLAPYENHLEPALEAGERLPRRGWRALRA